MRAGFLIAGAFILALAAIGAFFWTDLWNAAEQATLIAPPPPTNTTPIESRLVTPMKQAETVGGFAATFAERERGAWEITPGHRIERFAVKGGDPVFARVSSGVGLDKSQVIDGLYVELPLEFARMSTGKRIEVGVVIRAAQSNPSAEFSMLYATRQAGNSGWRTFQLSPDFELRAFMFDVPPATEGYSAKPAIVVRADPQGRGLGVELIGVYAKVVAPSEVSANAHFRVDFSPNYSANWALPEGHSLSLVRDPQTREALGRLTSSRPLQAQELAFGSQGASVIVPPQFSQQLNGKKINIVIRAKAADKSPSAKLQMMFATQKAGNTGWLSVPIGPELESHSFMYSVPKVPDGYSDPFLIVLNAENSGTAQSVDVESIEVVATQLK